MSFDGGATPTEPRTVVVRFQSDRRAIRRIGETLGDEDFSGGVGLGRQLIEKLDSEILAARMLTDVDACDEQDTLSSADAEDVSVRREIGVMVDVRVDFAERADQWPGGHPGGLVLVENFPHHGEHGVALHVMCSAYHDFQTPRSQSQLGKKDLASLKLLRNSFSAFAWVSQGESWRTPSEKSK